MSQNLSDDLMIGAKNIGDHMGISERQAFHMLENSQIPGFKLGNKWAARKSTLNEHIARLEREATAPAA